MKYEEENTKRLRYFDVACVLSLALGHQHDGLPFASPEEMLRFAQELVVLGLYWPLVNDSLNCSRQSLASE